MKNGKGQKHKEGGGKHIRKKGTPQQKAQDSSFYSSKISLNKMIDTITSQEIKSVLNFALEGISN